MPSNFESSDVLLPLKVDPFTLAMLWHYVSVYNHSAYYEIMKVERIDWSYINAKEMLKMYTFLFCIHI